jgi:hypothetical protein
VLCVSVACADKANAAQARNAIVRMCIILPLPLTLELSGGAAVRLNDWLDGSTLRRR